jgi:hypothetical protein
MNDKIEKYRKSFGSWESKEGDSFGLFFIPYKITAKIPLKVLSSPLGQGEWDHVSVSLPDRCPTWDEMCFVKNLFFSESDVVIQYHPAKKDYINNHPYCLHLWKCNVQDFPTPPSLLVGLK